MAYERVGGRHFEVSYQTVDDMDPELQASLLTAIERELKSGPVSILFRVNTLDVPREVPEFWLGVTKRLAPGLCAMAIVSDSLAVRAAASGFSVTNRVRRVKVSVKAFKPEDVSGAQAWCEVVRTASALSPTVERGKAAQ